MSLLLSRRLNAVKIAEVMYRGTHLSEDNLLHEWDYKDNMRRFCFVFFLQTTVDTMARSFPPRNKLGAPARIIHVKLRESETLRVFCIFPNEQCWHNDIFCALNNFHSEGTIVFPKCAAKSKCLRGKVGRRLTFASLYIGAAYITERSSLYVSIANYFDRKFGN